MDANATRTAIKIGINIVEKLKLLAGKDGCKKKIGPREKAYLRSDFEAV